MDKAYTESCTSAGNDITTVKGWYWHEPGECAEEEQVVILGTLQPECFGISFSEDCPHETVKILELDDMTIIQTKKLFGGY